MYPKEVHTGHRSKEISKDGSKRKRCWVGKRGEPSERPKIHYSRRSLRMERQKEGRYRILQRTTGHLFLFLKRSPEGLNRRPCNNGSGPSWCIQGQSPRQGSVSSNSKSPHRQRENSLAGQGGL